LSKTDVQTINKMILGSTDKCYRCKQTGHFTNQCPGVLCTRCGRNSHTVDKCYAKTHINTKQILESDTMTDIMFKSLVINEYVSDITGCLGDAVSSMSNKFIPQEYIDEDLRTISKSDEYDNSVLIYKSEEYTYEIEHHRTLKWLSFSHDCYVVGKQIQNV